ncbi:MULTISPECIES: hypothetical protein [Halomonas]|uniref:TrfB transcriptional repressor protein domain-containing protein n=1 Tax=Halomonas halophila TaxID=29573 RepID=A0ABQ0U444_9GAMM|nr:MULTISPECIES: hypothetical protein [Halomonas]MDR5890295.1 hypothetical protein [Halomonas salina]WJY05787.1 hypothetical protein QWG60_08635 [Halomonas halophila]GEK72951.1 hypothetical protein HHA04nite_14950 [Halomonas halophila]
MDNQRKAPELAATSVEGTDTTSPNAFQFNALDALRKSILWRLSNLNVYEQIGPRGVYHGILIGHGTKQGFTESQARKCIEALAADGLATFHVNDAGRVVVREVLS